MCVRWRKLATSRRRRPPPVHDAAALRCGPPSWGGMEGRRDPHGGSSNPAQGWGAARQRGSKARPPRGYPRSPNTLRHGHLVDIHADRTPCGTATSWLPTQTERQMARPPRGYPRSPNARRPRPPQTPSPGTNTHVRGSGSARPASGRLKREGVLFHRSSGSTHARRAQYTDTNTTRSQREMARDLAAGHG